MMLNGWTLSGLMALVCAGGGLADEVASIRIVDGYIGFDGALKVGHWTPVFVDIVGDVKAARPTVHVTVLDNDGVAMTVAAPLPLEDQSPEAKRRVLLYTRLGRLGTAVQVSLRADDGTILDRREFSPENRDEAFLAAPLPATGQLIVQLGRGSLGLAEALGNRESIDAAKRTVVRVDDVASLPPDWVGYDGADVIVLAANDLEFCERLAADARRFNALVRWLQLGGRLVICGSRNAPSLFATGRPLATLLPGTYEQQIRLPQTRSVESYAGSSLPLHSGPTPPEIFVPLIVGVRGRVELFGQGETGLPLIIRAAHSFGEVAFVGLDLDSPPLTTWPGRAGLIRAVLRPYTDPGQAESARHSLVSLGYDDLAGALRQRLGSGFAGVTPIAFPLVAASIIGYLLLLGPLDYLLIEKVARRRWLAWVTFPAIVLATCAAAAWAARATKGAVAQRLNAVELVDVDITTGVARGTCWAALYTADARRFDLRLEPRLAGRADLGGTRQLASLGLPGNGIGGMHARGLEFELVPTGYATSLALDELHGVPILTAATKSFLARWEAPIAKDQPLCEASLVVNDDGLLVGTVTNRTGAPLRNAYLLHGQWGYMLGTLADGSQTAVGPERRANRTRTLVLRRAGHEADAAGPGVFLPDRASVAQLLNVMMFYEAAGGYDFAGLPNRYQSYCDLSRLLDLDRAILVANVDSPGSRWLESDSDLALAASHEAADHNLICRFILPIDDGPQTTDN